MSRINASTGTKSANSTRLWPRDEVFPRFNSTFLTLRHHAGTHRPAESSEQQRDVASVHLKSHCARTIYPLSGVNRKSREFAGRPSWRPCAYRPVQSLGQSSSTSSRGLVEALASTRCGRGRGRRAARKPLRQVIALRRKPPLDVRVGERHGRTAGPLRRGSQSTSQTSSQRSARPPSTSLIASTTTNGARSRVAAASALLDQHADPRMDDALEVARAPPRRRTRCAPARPGRARLSRSNTPSPKRSRIAGSAGCSGAVASRASSSASMTTPPMSRGSRRRSTCRSRSGRSGRSAPGGCRRPLASRRCGGITAAPARQHQPRVLGLGEGGIDVGQLAGHAAQLDEVGLDAWVAERQLELALAHAEPGQVLLDDLAAPAIGILRQHLRARASAWRLAAARLVAGCAVGRSLLRLGRWIAVARSSTAGHRPAIGHRRAPLAVAAGKARDARQGLRRRRPRRPTARCTPLRAGAGRGRRR